MLVSSFSKTPQATDDTYAYLEDDLVTSGSLLLIDVMANDLGGKAKTLFSIDDGNGGSLLPTDLLSVDGLVGGISAWEATATGNMARINNGKIEINLANTYAALGISGINGLTATDVITDTLVYAIRLGNGTLSWAHVNVTIQGQNDAASIAGDTTGSIGEDDTSPVTGTLTVSDVDRGQSFMQAATGASAHGTWSVDVNGNWGFQLNTASVQSLNTGQSAVDSFVFTSRDGTASQTVSVTINGSNEAALPVTLSAPGAPVQVHAADLNGDGNQDLIFLQRSSSQMAVMLGNGNGTFGPIHAYAAAGSAFGLSLADFNSDGRLDAVTGSYTGGAPVSVFLGNADGSFGAAQVFAGGVDYSADTTTADFNGDGKLDFAINDNLTGGVRIFLGHNDGTFTSGDYYYTGQSSTGVEAADFNSDSIVDLAVSHSFGQSVAILLGNGDGTFNPNVAPTLSVAGGQFMEVTDLNHDGKSDLLVADAGGPSLGVFLGNGDGTFQTMQSFATADGPVYLALGDLNGDGKTDTVVSCQSGDAISVLFGDGLGGFSPEQRIAVGVQPQGVALADFDGDGKLDIAVSNGGSDTISLIMNQWM